jgi:hypothetical protein
MAEARASTAGPEDDSADQTVRALEGAGDSSRSDDAIAIAEGPRAAEPSDPTRHQPSRSATRPAPGPSLRIRSWALGRERLAGLLKRRVVGVAGVGLLLTLALSIYLVWSPERPPEGPRREEVVALQEQVGTAHQAAVNASADRLAQSTFESAVDGKRQADLALSRQDFLTARSRYMEALTGFQSAAAHAKDVSAQLAQKAEAEASLDRAGGARDAAEKADASRHAPDLMKSAQARERDGHAELRRGDYAAATLAFQTAEGEYRQAIARVPAVVVPPVPLPSAELSETRNAAASKRSLATQAGAEALAKPSFDAATVKWNQAEDSTRKGDEARALLEFKDANRLWEEAERRARTTLRDAAEKARSRFDKAEKARADLFFKDLFESASTKLSQGDDLSRRQRWAAAVQAYAEATAGFDEVMRGMDGVPRIQAEADVTKSRRAQALRAGADRLAKEFFQSAADKHVRADRLARGTDVLATIEAYKAAADGYEQAERRALDSAR